MFQLDFTTELTSFLHVDNENKLYITKTAYSKQPINIENFQLKKGKFSDKKILIFFIFLLET